MGSIEHHHSNSVILLETLTQSHALSQALECYESHDRGLHVIISSYKLHMVSMTSIVIV